MIRGGFIEPGTEPDFTPRYDSADFRFLHIPQDSPFFDDIDVENEDDDRKIIN